ncbi:MAG: CSLREA domain-containing protein, partial [Gammaproteobacteria bacterium]|nr:CSLREA domain-containing protein [Gammaproteobacteria bacterium]
MPIANAATFTVTKTADTNDGTCDADCSLHEAIVAANGSVGPHTIAFNIPAGQLTGGVAIISLVQALPSIIQASVTIDGTTQTTNVGNTNLLGPEISLSNGSVPAGTHGLRLAGGNGVVRGLVIGGFNGDPASGVHVTSSNNTIAGCYLGTTPAGVVSNPNFYGVYVLSGTGNTIGGIGIGDGNVISGNSNDGLRIESAANFVKGNFIGTDRDGTSSLQNGGSGIDLNSAGATGNTIGGTTDADRNVISGNFYNGVVMSGGGNTVLGNHIGMDVNGTAGIGNLRNGVWTVAANNVIGGTDPDAGNLVSDNNWAGIRVDGAGATGTIIQGNLIGTDAAGTANFGNTVAGIYILNGASQTTVGGIGANEANTIAFNTGDGVFVDGAASDDNEISANSIFENGGLGIDLAPDGVGTGSGANQNKAAPTIDSITAGASDFTVTATVDSGDIVEFFRVNNAAGPAVTPDGTGSGEGFLYLGRCVDNGACSGPHVDAVADGDGGNGGVQATILFSGLSGNDYLTGTAIDSSDNTSQFASNVQAPVPECPGAAVTTTTDSLDPGTLRSCVIWANGNPGDDTITLPAGTYTLDLVGAGEDNAVTGDLDINDPLTLLTINGAGARTTFIDGNGTDRIFDLKSSNGDLSLSGMTLRNGDAQNNDGGAIQITDNTVTLTDVWLTGNSASPDAKGGAIHVSSGDARVDINRATFDNNSAKEGGAIFGTGGGTRVNIKNATFTANSAVDKGGAMRVDHVALVNVTIVGNSATPAQGGGVHETSGQVFTAINTIIANNTGGDCISTIDSGNNNIDSDGTCGFATTANPLLGALANNGGQTDTMYPQPGSPAIEGGTNVLAPPVDQRSQPRPDGPLYDVGAVEAVIHELTGKVFEDADFAGSATDFGAGDLALANVDVELYTSTGTYISSTTTDGSGDFSFWVVNGDYKVRARSATIGDGNTAPDGGLNAGPCAITDPASGIACAVAEQTWGNGAAAIGGQFATVDDTATNDNAGPGDTWVSVNVNDADVSSINFGFAYNLIANTENSGQGSLDRFIRNANAIGSANGTTANYSEFAVPVSELTAGVALIEPTTALPILTDAGTTIDGTTQKDNIGPTNLVTLGTG